MVLTAGLGFFTDAYDLFVIGIVTAILAPIWHLSTLQLAILNGSALAAAGAGAVLFGTLADKFGRKKMYGMEVLILFFGAILSASALNFTWLLIARLIVGFGIGGDYPSSAVVASEHSDKSNRGYLVLLVFAMQAAGLVVGPLFASTLLSIHIPGHAAWRILLGVGAIPAAYVFFLRRRLAESPHFLASKKAPVEASRIVSHLSGYKDKVHKLFYQQQQLRQKKYIIYLIGTAGAWFLLDIALYGNGVSSILIMDKIAPHASLVIHTLLSGLIFLCFAVPGYFLAAKQIDRIGRKKLQAFGFFMIAVCYTLIATIPAIRGSVTLFFIVFGLSFFFVNFGPNTTTFLIPSEIYPTNIRAKAHGISAATGKLGAFIGAFVLPILLKSHGLPFTLGLLAIVSFLGIFTTFLVPEMKNRELSETEQTQ